jgi:hypothetical protein
MISDIVFEQNLLSDTECQYIIDLHKDKSFERSKFRNQSLPVVRTIKQISTETEIDTNDEGIRTLLDRITDVVKTANETMFFLDTDYTLEARIMKFDGDEKSFISQCARINWLSKDRHNKIFACVNLTPNNEYEGSEIILYNFWTAIPTLAQRRERGYLMFWPCMKRTEITPILKGTRYMLFIDYTGPCWK